MRRFTKTNYTIWKQKENKFIELVANTFYTVLSEQLTVFDGMSQQTSDTILLTKQIELAIFYSVVRRILYSLYNRVQEILKRFFVNINKESSSALYTMQNLTHSIGISLVIFM